MIALDADQGGQRMETKAEARREGAHAETLLERAVRRHLTQMEQSDGVDLAHKADVWASAQTAPYFPNRHTDVDPNISFAK